MAAFYKLASRVVVWLGPVGDDSSYAFEVMSNLGSKIIVDWNLQEMKPAVADNCDARLVDTTKPLPYRRRAHPALYRLLGRSWFEGFWFRQEISLANPDAIMMCGFDLTTWQTFSMLVFACIASQSKKAYPNPFLMSITGVSAQSTQCVEPPYVVSSLTSCVALQVPNVLV